jgi:hypothetical protein
MKSSQIPYYMACPILYWPWLWLQFRRLDRWMAQRVEQGEDCGVILHMGPRGTLSVSFVSDNLRDDLPKSYTTLTFESLTWAYFPEWMYTVARTQPRPITLGSEGAQAILRPSEISEALLPIP